MLALQRVWAESGHFWQSRWNNVLDLFAHNEFYIHTYGTFLVTFLVYWSVGLFYTVVDMTGKPSYILKYKIQDPNSQYPVKMARIRQVLAQVLFNQLVVGMPLILATSGLYRWRGVQWQTLPSLPTVILDVIVCIAVQEIGFYYSHRLVHNPFLYKHIHKRHHEWQTPIAITAIYCHPIEHAIANLTPVALGPLIMGSHIATTWLWFTYATVRTLSDHSGYHLPFFNSPEFHDYHHLKYGSERGSIRIFNIGAISTCSLQ